MEKQDKALDNVLSIKRKRIMIYFIEATEKLIRLDGVDGLSIRKIAGEAGYNSATIYNYFNDLEQLSLFGSVCYLRDYIHLLEQELKPDMHAIDQYRTIYRCFNECAFRTPDIFHNMFFGRYSHKLGAVLHVYYYELFPDELMQMSEHMRKMLVAGNVRERDQVIMEKMVREGDVKPERADITLDLVISLHQHFIYGASLGQNLLETEEYKAKFDRLFEYILAAAR